MSFVSGDIHQAQGPQAQLSTAAASNGQPSLSSSGIINGKRNIESLPFDYQFAEVEKAITNFNKHQQFNHHYAPNVNLNRHNHNHNHHHHNNQNNHRHNNNHHNSNNNYNHVKHHHQNQQSFAINAQLKQQQQQQFINNNNQQQFTRYRQVNNGLVNQKVQQPPQQLIQQQYINEQLQQQLQQLQQLQHPQQFQMAQQVPFQQLQQQYQSLPINNVMLHSADLKFDAFQQAQPQLNHPDLMNPIRNTSPTFSASVRPGSGAGFGSPLEQINSNSSFGLTNSDLLANSMTTASSSGEYVDKKLSLDNSTSSYLGDIWGSSKGLSNSTSVWA